MTAEIGKLLPQSLKLGAQLGHFGFQRCDALVAPDASAVRLPRRRRVRCRSGSAASAAEQVGVARLLGAGLPGQQLRQRRIVVDEFCRTSCTSSRSSMRCMRSLRPRNSPGVCGPRSSRVQSRALSRRPRFRISPAVLKARHPSLAARHSGQPLFLQRMQGRAHGGLIQLHHRFAVRLLIAGGQQRVEGQRVVVRSGDLFFQQRGRALAVSTASRCSSNGLSSPCNGCERYSAQLMRPWREQRPDWPDSGCASQFIRTPSIGSRRESPATGWIRAGEKHSRVDRISQSEIGKFTRNAA